MIILLKDSKLVIIIAIYTQIIINLSAFYAFIINRKITMNINWGKKNESLQSEVQILGRKTDSQGKAFYKVKWLKKNTTSWQPLANLKAYILLIREYQKKYQQNMKNWSQIFQKDKQKLNNQELYDFCYSQKQIYNNPNQQNKFYRENAYIQSSNKKDDNASLYSNMFRNTSMYNYKISNKYLNMANIDNKTEINSKKRDEDEVQKEGQSIRNQSSILNLLQQQGQVLAYRNKNQLKLTQTEEEKKLRRDQEQQKVNLNQIRKINELSKPVLRDQKLVLFVNQTNTTQIETQMQKNKPNQDYNFSNQLIQFSVQNPSSNITAQGLNKKNEINNKNFQINNLINKQNEEKKKIMQQRPNNSQIKQREENVQMFKALKRIAKSNNKKIIRVNRRTKLFRQCYLLQQKKITCIKKIQFMQQAWWAIVLTEDGNQITILRDQLRVTNPDLLLSYYQAQYQNKLKYFSITM